jgi:Domain of unknown function (DUF4401)
VSVADLLRPRRLEARFPERRDDIARIRRELAGPPWYLQLALGFGLSLAAALGCAGLGALLDAPGPIGLILAVGASAASWLPVPWWGRPFVLGGVLLARPLLFSTVEQPEPWVLAEIVLFLVHRDPINRFVAVAAAFLALTASADELIEVWTLLALALGVGALATRPQWVHLPREVRQPLWYGALGALAFALVAPSWPGTTYAGVATAIVVGAAAAIAAGTLVRSSPLDRAAAVVFPIALAALTVPVPGVMVALVVGALGFVLRAQAVWGVGVAAFGAYGTWFMYDLEWPLWAKGSAMIGTGAVLVAGGLLAGRNRGEGT